AITNRMGIVGVYVSNAIIRMTIGYVSYVIPMLGLLWGWWIFGKKRLRDLGRLTAYTMGLALLASVAVGLQAVVRGVGGLASYRYAGLVGGLLAKLFHDFLGSVGTTLLLLGGALVLVRGYFKWSLYGPFEKVSSAWRQSKDRRRMRSVVQDREEGKRKHTQELLARLQGERETAGIEFEEPEAVPAESAVQVSEDEEKEDWLEREPPEERVAVSPQDYSIDEEIMEKEVDLDSQLGRPRRRKYHLPAVDLLDKHKDVSPSASHEELVDKASFLVQSLMTFGVEGKVVNISPGPIITLFELEPAEGVRVNKFVQLSDDLARVMEASRVRIIAPIPGKSSVGIEIPNKNPSIVYLRSVINSEKFVSSDSLLTVALAKTTSGESYVIELDRMPHLLVAGTTGSGKSVCINTIIASILYRATPEEVRFILIDPKKLELAAYRRLEDYHLITADDIDEYVISSPENTVLALRAAEQEMSRRYDVLADAAVRNIREYRERAAADNRLESMPYIVVIIDELADLMMKAPKEVEAPIGRLAQMARAVGVHLVVATQRPSVDVITGVIKANFPARIAFQVATKVDSRTIIDSNGAEKLIGKGDMLFLPPGTSQPIRLHNTFVSLDEIERISRSLPNLLSLSLTGGEPYLRPDLPEIAAAFERNSHVRNIQIPSNGLLVDRTVRRAEALLKRVRRARVCTGVSLDGPEHLNDPIRGEGTFRRIVDGLR
ncbi:MAG: DNA translocase FtsK 4TM domain-containing protein, partial [Fidelibacterota bacterium]